MNPHFRDLLQKMKKAGEAMLAAHEAMVTANAAVNEAIDAAIHANDEHHDLRETVERLQAAVLQLADEVKALRRDHDRGTDEP